MKKFTILAATIAASVITAHAALYTQGYDTIDVTERDDVVLGGASPNISFLQVFGPTNGVNVNGGTLNFTGNQFGRGVGVWVDSSTWAAGTITVTFDISNFAGTNDSTSSTLRIYTATGLDATNSATIDIQTGGTPNIGGLTTAVADTAITANGTALSLTYTNVAGTDATAFVFNSDESNVFSADNLIVTIPEPSSTLLLGAGALGFMLRRRRAQAMQ